MSRRLWSITAIGIAVMAVLDLAGCTPVPPAPPAPPPLPATVVCAVPLAMTEREPMPLAPHGTDSQQEVALYLLALHRWGVRGWQRLAAIRDDSERCRDSAEPTDAED